jgi:hypothetical protein
MVGEDGELDWKDLVQPKYKPPATTYGTGRTDYWWERDDSYGYGTGYGTGFGKRQKKGKDKATGSYIPDRYTDMQDCLEQIVEDARRDGTMIDVEAIVLVDQYLASAMQLLLTSYQQVGNRLNEARKGSDYDSRLWHLRLRLSRAAKELLGVDNAYNTLQGLDPMPLGNIREYVSVLDIEDEQQALAEDLEDIEAERTAADSRLKVDVKLNATDKAIIRQGGTIIKRKPDGTRVWCNRFGNNYATGSKDKEAVVAAAEAGVDPDAQDKQKRKRGRPKKGTD